MTTRLENILLGRKQTEGLFGFPMSLDLIFSQIPEESEFGVSPEHTKRSRNVQEVHTFQGETVMIWGGIILEERTNLVLLELRKTIFQMIPNQQEMERRL